MIKVLFFSVLRDLTGMDQMDLPASVNTSSVEAAIEVIFEQHPRVKEWDSKLLIAVNGEFAERHQELKDGDELALMPPVQGG